VCSFAVHINVKEAKMRFHFIMKSMDQSPLEVVVVHLLKKLPAFYGT
jgi:hypothetical protein